MEPVPVARHVILNESASDVVETRMLKELNIAQQDDHPMLASGARLSQGGQSIARNGTTITLDQNFVEPYPGLMSYKVSSGTPWSSVIPHLDRHGFSPAVMQANSDFSVGASFAVNAHGWPAPFSGCGSTVLSLRMLLADGSHVTCARRSKSEIFYASMGGYGLLGVITEMHLSMLPNARLHKITRGMSGDELAGRLAQQVSEDMGVVMAYGQLSVALENFLQEAQLITYHRAEDQTYLPPIEGPGLFDDLDALAIDRQRSDERAKRHRWWIETEVEPRFGKTTTRNQVLTRPLAAPTKGSQSHSTILQEYFLPADQVTAFLSTCRDVIPNSYQDLIDAQMTFVRKDSKSLLSYAPADRVALRLTFSQEKSARAEHDMNRINRTLINRALDLGGSFYLPFRLHATLEQVEAAYPKAAEFATVKRKYDPDTRFSNALWEKYLSAF
jgi:FAD/FMN-containing dehydrogenase